MSSDQGAGKPTARRYSVEEKAAAVRMVRSLREFAGEYVPYRMLEVEAAANAVYAWAAHQILARRLPEERPTDPAEYAAVHHEHQALRHRAHHKLVQAFDEPEICRGGAQIVRAPQQCRSGAVEGES